MRQATCLGDRSPLVTDIRRILATRGLLANTDPAATDLFDDATHLAVRGFQQHRGLSVDGVVGPETWTALQAARWRLGDRILLNNPALPLIGDDVADLQQQLLEIGYAPGRPDSRFGTQTAAALASFQRDLGLRSDGVCGPVSLRALRQLEKRRIVGGRPQFLREMMVVADSGPSLLGKRIVIDPGHGGDDPGEQVGEVCEADLVYDLAERLQGRLIAQGVTTWLTRGRHSTMDEPARAQFANAQDADLVVSLHLDAATNPLANGLATFYYGSGRRTSTIGERFADLVQREVVARTGLADNRIHPKSWTLLLLTSMPTVRVELGYLSSPLDIVRLTDPHLRDRAAEGLLVAIQRLYLPREQDPPTGVLRLPALAT